MSVKQDRIYLAHIKLAFAQHLLRTLSVYEAFLQETDTYLRIWEGFWISWTVWWKIKVYVWEGGIFTELILVVNIGCNWPILCLLVQLYQLSISSPAKHWHSIKWTMCFFLLGEHPFTKPPILIRIFLFNMKLATCYIGREST